MIITSDRLVNWTGNVGIPGGRSADGEPEDRGFVGRRSNPHCVDWFSINRKANKK